MDLYALPPEEFTAARDAEVRRARADGDRVRARQLAGLRRPTASAHAVNALVRAEPALVDQLLELGVALAQAQADGQGAVLRSLGEQRRQLVEAVTDRAGVATGRPLTPAARVEVVATLEAALADPGSGEAVLSGRLVRALSYAGLGDVDLRDAVADGELPAPDAPDRHLRLEQAQQAVLDASGHLDDVVRQAERLEAERAARADQAEQAARQVEQSAQQVAAAERQLAQARERQTAAEQSEWQAVSDLAAAQERVAQAQVVAERAREALQRLTGQRTVTPRP